ncbi:MAG: DNA mismatch repair endonuclease MutL [Oscillospiraceae bacterium]|nr:DNA mismatch repair endonuclease MutL [Oscillospiraceae bacterium]
MPKIIQLSTHVANLIAAGEVVERPASVAKELLENAVDAGASKITIEIRDGGMTFLRVTDNGCGMALEDARTAFLRHATSKLRTAEDLAAIDTCGFRGEALAAIASVSRIDLLTKVPSAIEGVSLRLEAGTILEETEAGCPDGTTIIVRDLFFNTPARMKFMKSDTVEGSRVTAAVQLQALAHPSVSFRLLRDGKEVLHTPGTGKLSDAVFCVYGKECARMAKVDSRWEQYSLSGFVSKPSDARPSRNLQTFFVNGRPVKSRLLISALEEAYRNQIMTGKFPACVLHLNLPANMVDVNVHPAKTEVKFLNEKAVFDCVHYVVLGALNTATDRPEVKFRPAPQSAPATPPAAPGAAVPKQENFFRTMTAQEYKTFSAALKDAPRPDPVAAAATAAKVERTAAPMRETAFAPRGMVPQPRPVAEKAPVLPPLPEKPPVAEKPPVLPPAEPEPEQEMLPMPAEIPWELVGELYGTYIIVQQGEEAYLIDKHAAHERMLFEKLKANQENISSQMLLTPVALRLSPEAAAELLANKALLGELGFELEEFGENTVILRQVPMDLSPEQAKDAVEEIVDGLLNGRREKASNVRDEVLHTVACKAAIKAGWKNGREELLAVAKAVMSRDDLKHCPHGRPICITLSKKALERQFKRS